MQITENLLLKYKDNRIIRIVYYERISSIIYAVDMEKLRWPYLIKVDEILKDIKDEKVTILEDKSFMECQH